MSPLARLWIAMVLLPVSGPVVHADQDTDIPPDPQRRTAIAIEASPEFLALSTGSRSRGSYADTLGKLVINHTIADSWIATGLIQMNVKSDNTHQLFGEGAVGYRFKLEDFTLRPSIAIGNTGGATGLGANGTANAFYYAFYLAGDLKLNSQWTWNVFELRYRNAFDYRFITPRVGTGLTYEWSPFNFIYGSLGYSWKDTGLGLLGDKINVAFGYRRIF